MLNENNPPPTQAEIAARLNAEDLSGKHIAILRRMDEKNVDRDDLAALIALFIRVYNDAKR